MLHPPPPQDQHDTPRPSGLPHHSPHRPQPSHPTELTPKVQKWSSGDTPILLTIFFETQQTHPIHLTPAPIQTPSALADNGPSSDRHPTAGADEPPRFTEPPTAAKNTLTSNNNHPEEDLAL
jgi:hypothetical protein